MKKGLKIISILMILLGLLTLAVGISTIALFMMSGDTSNEVHALIGLAFIFAIVNGLLEFFGGYLGLRAAKHPRKATDAIVFGFVTLVVGVASLVLNFSIQNICACIIPLIYFICAKDVGQIAKKEYELHN